MKIIPEKGKEIEVKVNGYGCKNDCDEYIDGSWQKTEKTIPWW